MIQTFKIYFVNKKGVLVENPSKSNGPDAIPVIDIVVTAPRANLSEGVSCRALIDTGADCALISKELVARFTNTEKAIMKNSTSIGEEVSTLHDLTFYLTDINGEKLSNTSDVLEMKYASTAYSVILGRTLFRHGSLLLDYRRSKFEFEIGN